MDDTQERERKNGVAKTSRVDLLMAVIGNNLKARRVHLGRTQQEIAEAVGLERGTYGSYEEGRVEIKATTLHHLARALGAPISYFYGEVPLTELAEADALRRIRQIAPEVRRALAELLLTEPEERQGIRF